MRKGDTKKMGNKSYQPQLDRGCVPRISIKKKKKKKKLQCASVTCNFK
jgi:hypothetical protein